MIKVMALTPSASPWRRPTRRGGGLPALPSGRRSGFASSLSPNSPTRRSTECNWFGSHFGLGIVLRLDRAATRKPCRPSNRPCMRYRPYSDTSDDSENPHQFAAVHNELAWLLATCAEAKHRDPGRAVASARKAVELAPDNGGFWNTRSAVACYGRATGPRRGRRWRNRCGCAGAVTAFDWFFLAMLHGQQGEAGRGRQVVPAGCRLDGEDGRGTEELRRFRAEAAELLGVSEK